MQQYMLGAKWCQNSLAGKNLGVLVGEELTMSSQYVLAAKKAYWQALGEGGIKKTVRHKHIR